LRDQAPDTASLYQAINVDGTRQLAEAAAGSVRRFVFVSSIGVNGESTNGGPFKESDAPAPVGAYAKSKWLAEENLRDMRSSAKMEIVIVRPSMVYGPGAKGNLLRLLNLVATRLPLPLGSLRNPRSFIGVRNLCDLLVRCVERREAADELFLAAEPNPRSTAELLEALAAQMGHANQIVQCPLPFLRTMARLAGRQEDLVKLSASLEVDASKARHVLDWHPRTSFEEEIQTTVRWYSAAGR
jgi:nucleoside-diphosphate-sugar epimerase